MQAGDVDARLSGQVGVDPAGQDRVDLDVVLGPGGGERPGELDDAALARGIGRGERDAEDRGSEPMLMILPPPAATIAG